ncbi:dynein light chain type 1 domain-containing protein [Ditylenchus destructor]|nr:dynein light chain type 1 domain-containing protein [Ditylenchus destructor]
MSYEPLSSAPRKNEPDASKRPNITRVGEFSVDKHRNFLRGDRTSARYLRNAYTREEAMKDLPHALDLRDGYPSWVKNLRNDKCSQIQKWIIGSGQWGASLDEVVDAEIVTNRGTLERIANSPFNFCSTGLRIYCRKYKGVIFMFDSDTDEKKKKCAELCEDSMNRFGQYADQKFERLISSPDQTGEPDFSEPVNENSEFYAVLKADFGDIKVLYRSKIDCLTPDGQDYLEAKTLINGFKNANIQRKALQWWLQTYFATVNSLVIGLRSKYNRCEIYKVLYVHVNGLLKHLNGWDVNICFTFLQEFLRKIRSIMFDLDEDKVLIAERRHKSYDFTFKPKVVIKAAEMSDKMKQEVTSHAVWASYEYRNINDIMSYITNKMSTKYGSPWQCIASTTGLSHSISYKPDA